MSREVLNPIPNPDQPMAQLSDAEQVMYDTLVLPVTDVLVEQPVFVTSTSYPNRPASYQGSSNTLPKAHANYSMPLDESGTEYSQWSHDSAAKEAAAKVIKHQKYLVQTQNARLVDAREDFAELSAGRGRRGFLSRLITSKYSKKEVAKAQSRYESLRDLSIGLEKDTALSAGVSKADLELYGDEFYNGDADKMTKAVFTSRLLETGKYETTKEGKMPEHIPPKNWLDKTAQRFYLWYGEQADAKLLSTATLKKSAVMGAAGAVVAVPAVVFGSLVFGPIIGGAAGALIAGKIAKGAMVYHADRRAEGSPRRIQKQHADLKEIIKIGKAKDIGAEISRQTSNEVYKNNTRIVKAIGAAAIGGALAESGLSHLVDHVIPKLVPKLSFENPLGFGLDSSQKHAAASNKAASHVINQHLAHHPGLNTPKEVDLGVLRTNNDSPWSVIAHYMNTHGYNGQNNAAVMRLDKATLAHDGVKWDAASKLPNGFRLHIPQALLASLVKKQG